MSAYACVDEILAAAGRLALSHFGRAAVRFKADDSPVTAADEAVEALVRGRLAARFPHYGFLGEETGGTAGGRAFILDPVDGTSAFAAGFPFWGVALAAADGTRVEAGWLALPALGRTYACRDGVATENGKVLKAGRPAAAPAEATLLVPSTCHRDFALDGFPGKARSFGSTALHALYAATGRAEGALLGRVHLWDIACAFPFMERFGARLAHLDGGEVDMGALFATRRLPRPALLARSAGAFAALAAVVRVKG